MYVMHTPFIGNTSTEAGVDRFGPPVYTGSTSTVCPPLRREGVGAHADDLRVLVYEMQTG